MGMRGVIAHRTTDGTVTFTTNQWCTKPMENLLDGLKITKNAHQESPQDAAKRIFDAISTVGHIGSLESATMGYIKENDRFSESFTTIATDGDKVFGFHGHHSELIPIETKTGVSSDTLVTLVQNHHHAQDGWSIYYDESYPDEIHMWIDPECLKKDVENHRVIML